MASSISLNAQSEVRDAVGHPVTLPGSVQETELKGVDAQQLRKLVDDGFNGEGALRLSRRRGRPGSCSC